MSEKSNEDDLRRGMYVKRAGDEQVGQCNAVCGLGPNDLEGGEGWGENRTADETVGYSGKDGVVAGREALQGIGGLDSRNTALSMILVYVIAHF